MSSERVLDLAWVQVWQVAIAIVIVLLVIRFFAHNRPHLAYVLWLVVLVKCVTPPVVTSPGGIFSYIDPIAAVPPEGPNSNFLYSNTDRQGNPDGSGWKQFNYFSQSGIHRQGKNELPSEKESSSDRKTAASVEGTDLPPISPGQQIQQSSFWNLLTPSFGWRGWLVSLWLLTSLLWFLIAGIRTVSIVGRIKKSRQPVSQGLNEAFEQAKRQVGLKRYVDLVVSSMQVGPAVIGIFRPTVVLPKLLADKMSQRELLVILAHELNHVRRNDLILGAFQTVTQAVWWFHPFVWLANRWTSREVERCCDEQTMGRLGIKPSEYARALVGVLENKNLLKPVPAFPGVRPAELTSKRLERIMSLKQGCKKRVPWLCWGVALIVGAIVLPGASQKMEAKVEANFQDSPKDSVPSKDIHKESPKKEVIVQNFHFDSLVGRFKDQPEKQKEIKLTIQSWITENAQDSSDWKPPIIPSLPIKQTAKRKKPDVTFQWNGSTLSIGVPPKLKNKVSEAAKFVQKNGLIYVYTQATFLNIDQKDESEIRPKWNSKNNSKTHYTISKAGDHTSSAAKTTVMSGCRFDKVISKERAESIKRLTTGSTKSSLAQYTMASRAGLNSYIFLGNEKRVPVKDKKFASLSDGFLLGIKPGFDSYGKLEIQYHFESSQLQKSSDSIEIQQIGELSLAASKQSIQGPRFFTVAISGKQFVKMDQVYFKGMPDPSGNGTIALLMEFQVENLLDSLAKTDDDLSTVKVNLKTHSTEAVTALEPNRGSLSSSKRKPKNRKQPTLQQENAKAPKVTMLPDYLNRVVTQEYDVSYFTHMNDETKELHSRQSPLNTPTYLPDFIEMKPAQRMAELIKILKENSNFKNLHAVGDRKIRAKLSQLNHLRLNHYLIQQKSVIMNRFKVKISLLEIPSKEVENIIGMVSPKNGIESTLFWKSIRSDNRVVSHNLTGDKPISVLSGGLSKVPFLKKHSILNGERGLGIFLKCSPYWSNGKVGTKVGFCVDSVDHLVKVEKLLEKHVIVPESNSTQLVEVTELFKKKTDKRWFLTFNSKANFGTEIIDLPKKIDQILEPYQKPEPSSNKRAYSNTQSSKLPRHNYISDDIAFKKGKVKEK